MGDPTQGKGRFEWPTLALVAACYGLWVLATMVFSAVWLPLSIALASLAIALHSSLSHEALHGHPFKRASWNAALVFPALTLFIPYLRFRDTHIAHHNDETLTDPYDDPESNYLDPAIWQGLPGGVQRLLRFNNTLIGRLSVGPLIAQFTFMRADLRAIAAGDRRVLAGWLWHLPAVAVVLIWLALSPMPVWAYVIAAYFAISILKIRTFLEHQAHEDDAQRTVIIEDRGPLALMFLNNNLHVVHHMHPNVPWYRLPALYWANRDRYLGRNHGYRYASYAEVFRRHLWRAKDPVPHPVWRR